MNSLIRSMKIYIKISFNIILLLFSLGFAAAIFIGTVVDPAKRGSHDYGSMIGCCGMAHCMLMLMFLNGNLRMTRTKYFASVPQARTLFTDAPIAAIAVLGLVFDAVLAVALLLRHETELVSDLLVFNAINTVIACFFNSLYGKNRSVVYNIILSVVFIMFLNQITLLKKASFIKNGFGLSLPVSAAAAAAIYIIGIAAAHFLMQMWWEKSGRNFNNDFNMIVQNTNGNL